MKTLRELKYNLLFEQQLYRKYLDDYGKGAKTDADKDKAEKVKTALKRDVTVFLDLKTKKEYVVKKSGDDGYSVKNGEVVVNRDAFFQGEKGDGGKVMDKKSTDGDGVGAAVDRKPAAGEPTDDTDAKAKTGAETDDTETDDTETDDTETDGTETGDVKKKELTPKQKEKEKKEGLRKGDQKRTKEALEMTKARAEKQAKKAKEAGKKGDGAGVTVSKAGESITVESVRKLLNGMSEDEIRSEMQTVVIAPDSVLDTETGREWADNGVNCAVKIRDKMEKEFGEHLLICL